MNIIQTLKRTTGVAKVKLKNAAPSIAITGGTIAMAAAGVWACKMTLRLNEVMAEHNETLKKAEKAAANEEIEYSEEDMIHDQKIILGKKIVAGAKLYAGPILLGTAGAIAIALGNKEHRRRTATALASLASVTETLRQYRKRVADKYGEEEERRLRYNLNQVKIDGEEFDENGKSKKVKKKVDVIDPNGVHNYSPYARFFDEASREWSKDPDQNFMFLRAQQKLANAKLIRDGYLFLNDVYDALDIPQTEEGHYVGWIYDEKLGKDRYVDFGIFDMHKEAVRDFDLGYERTILLDFNVDGPIVDKVKWSK